MHFTTSGFAARDGSLDAFKNAIVERPTSATDAPHHVRNRASDGASEQFDLRCSVVRTDADRSISRARAVAKLRMASQSSRVSTIVVPSRTDPSSAQTCANAALPAAPHFPGRSVHRGAFAGSSSVNPTCAA
jgi:hypothetical protein